MAKKNLEELSLGELLSEQMQGHLSASQLEEAKELAVERRKEGRKDLKRIFNVFVRDFFKGREIKIVPCTNYLDYLGILYRKALPSTKKEISRMRDRSLARDYEMIYRLVHLEGSKKTNIGGFGHTLQTERNLIEVAYSDSAKKNNPLNFLIVREKDIDRALDKGARLLIKSKGKKYVGDFFAIKLVLGRSDQVHDFLGGIYNHGLEDPKLYYSLSRVGFKPCLLRKPIVTKDGTVLSELQPPGIDDHYKYGTGRDHILQLSIYSERYLANNLWEIDFTDIRNMLPDERDHMRYAPSQSNETQKMKREEIKRRGEYICRGKELLEKFPEMVWRRFVEERPKKIRVKRFLEELPEIVRGEELLDRLPDLVQKNYIYAGYLRKRVPELREMVLGEGYFLKG